MKPKPLPPVERLRELIDYDPATGFMVWRTRADDLFSGARYPKARAARVWNAKFAGKPALASPTSNGYLHGSVDNTDALAHRVAWKIVTGQEPEDTDHINGDRTDNRFANLRSCSRIDNMRNRGLSSNNRSGHHGVWQEAATGKWCAQIEHEGTVTDLGRHLTKEAAVAARQAAERSLGFHPNHGTRDGHAIAAASS